MKKIFILALVLATLALSALGFAACDSCNHALLEHRDAIEAGCETDGNIEYWFCRLCGQYFSDEGKTKIAYADVVVGQLGHDMQDVQAVGATCDEPGNTAGKQCSRCDMSTVQMVQPSHDMIHHDEIPATCTEPGTKEHWTCSREDGVYFANEKGTATMSEINTPALGHDMEHHEGTPATCTEPGVKEYWTCSRHEGNYANEKGTETYDDLVEPATGHQMTHVDLLDATCTQDGHVEHWACANEIGGYYLDKDGNEKLDSIVIDAIGHDYSDEWVFNTTDHWHVCKNGCGDLVELAAHVWDEGEVTLPATTKNDGETLYNCEVCDQTKTEIIPMLKTFTLTVIEEDIFNNEDGGSVYVDTDIPLEDGKYVEGSKVYVTIVLNETFGLGSIYLNDDLIDDMPLATNYEYTFSFKIRRDTTLSVEFGKLITSTRTWKLYKSSNNEPEGLVDYEWDYYRKDAGSVNDPNYNKSAGYGSLMLYVYDATGIDNVRAHDFTADLWYLLHPVNGDLKWSVLNKEINDTWLEMVKYMPEEKRPYNFTLTFAMRLLPSEVKRGEGYVGSNLILPTATTVGGVSYDATMEYNYTKANASAPSTLQIGFNEQGTSVTFLRETGNNGAVFNTYRAAYVEVEMRKGDVVCYAYLFVEGNTLYMYSSTDKSGTRLSCGSVTNAYVSTGSFNSWAFIEYPDASIDAKSGWEFRTRIHVGEDSVWLYDGDWSESVKYIGYDYMEAPSFAMVGFNGSSVIFMRTGGKGLVFITYKAAYIEIELRKDDKVYTMYMFSVDVEDADGNVKAKAYLYDNLDMEGVWLDCKNVSDSYVSVSDFNKWASGVFEANFDVKTWEMRTKVHVDENSIWTEDGEWSEVVKYDA